MLQRLIESIPSALIYVLLPPLLGLLAYSGNKLFLVKDKVETFETMAIQTFSNNLQQLPPAIDTLSSIAGRSLKRFSSLRGSLKEIDFKPGKDISQEDLKSWKYRISLYRYELSTDRGKINRFDHQIYLALHPMKQTLDELLSKEELLWIALLNFLGSKESTIEEKKFQEFLDTMLSLNLSLSSFGESHQSAIENLLVKQNKDSYILCDFKDKVKQCKRDLIRYSILCVFSIVAIMFLIFIVVLKRQLRALKTIS